MWTKAAHSQCSSYENDKSQLFLIIIIDKKEIVLNDLVHLLTYYNNSDKTIN